MYIDEWEKHAKEAGGGFLSDSTAAGLRVTLTSTLEVLSYLNSTIGFSYLLTSRLSQDKLGNLFGIIRQSSGCNDHPTVSQFLVTVNLLAFYNLAKTPKGGNCAPDVVRALLSVNDVSKENCFLDTLDNLLDRGKLDGAEDIIDSLVCKESDHVGYVEKKSNSALVFYTAGYVARKTIAKNSCLNCATHLCVTRDEASTDTNSCYTLHFDNGGGLFIPAVPCQVQCSLWKMPSVFSLAGISCMRRACRIL